MVKETCLTTRRREDRRRPHRLLIRSSGSDFPSNDIDLHDDIIVVVGTTRSDFS